MIGRLLPVLGTLTLLATTYVSGQYALGIYREHLSPDAAVRDAEPLENQRQPASASLPKPRPDIYYAAITDRPIFEPTRRPVTMAPTPVEVEPETIEVAPTSSDRPPLPVVELLGVIRSSESGSALLSIDGGAALWFKEGATISGWRLNKVLDEQIEFVRDSESEIVDLYNQ